MALRRKQRMPEIDRKRRVEHNGIFPYLARYLEWGRAIKGVSGDTTRTRDASIRRFIDWCDERGLDDPQEITLPILERYQRHLFHYRKRNGEALGITAQESLLVSLKGFFKWLTRERYLPSNPASEMEIPRRPQRLPAAILEPDEIVRVFSQPDLGRPEGLRDRTMLEVLYATGMRRMELCNLSIYDLEHRRRTVTIRSGKGSKDRVVPLGERAHAWLVKYLDEAYPELVGPRHANHLFLTDFGEAFNRGLMGYQVRKLLDAAGIRKKGGCHLFRHACATHMLENGADIRYIQALLGHAELNTTQIYTRVNIDKLSEIHAATHPAKLRTVKDRDGQERMALLAALDAEPENSEES